MFFRYLYQKISKIGPFDGSNLFWDCVGKNGQNHPKLQFLTFETIENCKPLNKLFLSFAKVKIAFGFLSLPWGGHFLYQTHQSKSNFFQKIFLIAKFIYAKVGI